MSNKSTENTGQASQSGDASATENPTEAIQALFEQAEYRRALGLILGLDSQARLDPVILELTFRCLWKLGEYDGALSTCRILRKLRPQDPVAASFLARCYYELGRLEESKVVLEEHIPSTTTPRIELQLAETLMGLSELKRAEHCYRTVMEECPEEVESYVGLAFCAHLRGDFAAAVEWFEKAESVGRVDPVDRVSLGLLRFAVGDYARGWVDYGMRRSPLEMQIPGLSSLKPWDGVVSSNHTLLVQSEQGLGDTIHFVRYLEELSSRSMNVVLRCQPQLVELFDSALSGITVVGDGPLPSGIDSWVLLLDLPSHIDPELSNVPGRDGYLQLEPPASPSAGRQSSGGKLRVGIVWKTSATVVTHSYRSCPIEALQPLIGIGNVHWVNLQYGADGQRATELPWCDSVEYLGDAVDSFVDLARIMQSLDLVITVDTVTGHLAGALGVPVWIMLGCPPDWRWCNEPVAARSRWYASARLFRRQAIDEPWEKLIGEVGSALKELQSAS